MARDDIYYLVIIYLILINVITFVVFAIDKYRAIHSKNRIKERTLFELSLIFGSLGGIASMYIFRHKTRKSKFVIFMPIILILQSVLLAYIALNYM